MYGYYIQDTYHRFPHEWIDLPYHEKAAIFAYIDEKMKEEKKQRAKMEASQRKSGRGRKAPARRRRR